jgi:hypothetical protein
VVVVVVVVVRLGEERYVFVCFGGEVCGWVGGWVGVYVCVCVCTVYCWRTLKTVRHKTN